MPSIANPMGSTLSSRERGMVDAYIERKHPKALFLLLTRRQATRLQRAVSEKERVTVYEINPHSCLVMWSAVSTDAEAIRGAAKAVYRRLDKMEVAAIAVILALAASVGACAAWLILAYDFPDRRSLAADAADRLHWVLAVITPPLFGIVTYSVTFFKLVMFTAIYLALRGFRVILSLPRTATMLLSCIQQAAMNIYSASLQQMQGEAQRTLGAAIRRLQNLHDRL
ncbi:hypothetical protein NMY22_g2559 [Coprinellus aureogranulatus]|nr:hypothetical protein NMY22_g2559 [Coprinellus aureogranulatus]